MNININFYDKNYKYIYTFSSLTKRMDDLVYSINWNKANLKEEKFELLFCCADKCNVYEFICEDCRIKNIIKGKSLDISGLYLLEGLENNLFAIIGEKGVFLVNDAFLKLVDQKVAQIFDKSAYGGILMENNKLAFIKNFNLYNSKEKIN